MAGQKFYASPTDTFTWNNGAVGHRPGGSFDTLGPYAKVRNCPIDGTNLRLTCYATAHADSFFSVPAVTEYKRKRIAGFFMLDRGDIVFCPFARFRHLVGLTWDRETWIKELDRIAAEKCCFPAGEHDEAMARHWMPLFRQGLTPQQAWDSVPWQRDRAAA